MSASQPSILFVCTANICRSPMAEALFRSHLEKSLLNAASWRVESAGVMASDGEAASEGSLEVMRRRRLDLSKHRSRTVTRDLLSHFDLVLTMEQGHKDRLRLLYPEYADRVFMLSEMEGLLAPVRDPYGNGLTAYEVTAEILERMIRKGMGRVIRIVESNHMTT